MVVGLRQALVPFLLLATLASVPAAAAPPPDAFCVILIEGLDGMRLVRVLVDEDTTVEERAALFPEVDRDGDGNVTPFEGDLWRRANLQVFPRQEGLDGNRSLQLFPEGDGGVVGAPLYAATTRQVGHTFHKQDHTQPWPVQEAADLETQEVREFSFDHREGAMRYLLFGGDARNLPTSSTTTSPNYVIEYVVLRAPAGWVIERVEGHTYDGRQSWQPGVAEYDIPAFDTTKPYVVTFARVGEASRTATPTPSPTPTATGASDEFTIPAPAAALVAVALLALAARRRL